MKILFSYSGNQSAHHRIKKVAKYLERLGHKTRMSFKNKFGKSSIQWCDLFVYQILWEDNLAKKAHEYGKKAIVDIDDAIDPGAGPKEYLLDESGYDVLKENLVEADAVTVTTEYLKKRYNFNKNTHVLPNCIDPELFEGLENNNGGRFTTIGWAGGRTHKHDFRLANKQIARALSLPETKLAIIGFNNTGLEASFTDWTEKPKEFPRMLAEAGFDIGIAPTSDIPLNRAKSNLKYLEYSWLGIPTVGSHVTYHDCKYALVSKNWEEFGDNIIKLVKNRKLRERLGRNAQKYVKNIMICLNK